MLEYDDSAFYYFCLTLLGFYIVPGTIYLIFYQISPVLFPKDDLESKARTEAEKRKARLLKKETAGIHKLFTVGFFTNVIFLAVAYVVCIYLIMLVWNDRDIAQFDPYIILEIARDADDRVIRKAYRSLSLKWHPDKNPGNQYAEQMFMMVRKAYEALTDEAAKENWQKYGNPDGKQALEVSIGLPTFLLDKDNHTTILLVYLVILVIAIPMAVYCWYSESQQYGEKSIMYRTYNDFSQLLQDHTSTKYLPGILVTSSECCKLNELKEGDAEKLKELSNKLGANLVKPRHEKHLKVPEKVNRGNVLLHAYLYRLDIPECFQKTLFGMLKASNELIEAMLEILQSRRNGSWLQTAMNVIEFQQMLVQAKWIKETHDNLYQLPLTDHEVGHIIKGKGKQSVRSIADYLRMPDDQKKGLADLSDKDKEDVLRVCRMMPRLEVKNEVLVEDEEEIAEGDLITVRVTVTRSNLEEGEKAADVHAPNFPGQRQEGWWFIMATETKYIITMEKVVDNARTFVHDIKCFGPGMMLQAGHYKFDLYIMSDSYIGLDVQQKVEFDVIKASDLPEYKPHKDDLELDNEPTLFESLAGNVEDDSESDVDEDEEEREAAAAIDEGDDEVDGSGSGKKEPAAKRRVATDEAEDDD